MLDIMLSLGLKWGLTWIPVKLHIDANHDTMELSMFLHLVGDKIFIQQSAFMWDKVPNMGWWGSMVQNFW